MWQRSRIYNVVRQKVEEEEERERKKSIAEWKKKMFIRQKRQCDEMTRQPSPTITSQVGLSQARFTFMEDSHFTFHTNQSLFSSFLLFLF